MKNIFRKAVQKVRNTAANVFYTIQENPALGVAETLCTWDEKDWDIVAVYMVQLALGEITEEQYHQNLNAVAGITKQEA